MMWKNHRIDERISYVQTGLCKTNRFIQDHRQDVLWLYITLHTPLEKN